MLNLESGQRTFFPVPTGDLAREFGVGKTTVRAWIRRIQKTEPDQVMKKGTGTKSRYSITPSGMNLLTTSLKESLAVEGRKKVNFIQQRQDPVVSSSEPQAIVSRPPNSNPTLSEAIPLYSSLTRKIQLMIGRIDKLDGASLKEKRTLLILVLWRENVSIRAREETAKILGITPEEVWEIIKKKPSEEEEDRLETLFDKFLATKSGR